VGNARSPAHKVEVGQSFPPMFLFYTNIDRTGCQSFPPFDQNPKLRVYACQSGNSKPLLNEKDLPLLVTHSLLPFGHILGAVDAPMIASPTALISTPTSDVPTVLVLGPVDPANQSSSTRPRFSLILLHLRVKPSLLPLHHHQSTTLLPVSGDIFSLIIFTVVKANPPHHISNLLYAQ
jgi:hypothetical protein